MIIKLDMAGDIPIYLQLRNQIVIGIGRGDLPAGSSLPTVRQLADEIGVNMMTVSKTYTILKNDGYIEVDRRHGAKVNPKPGISTQYRERLEEELSLLIAESGLNGICAEDFMKLCNKIYGKMKGLKNVGGEG